jgi:hypothetical protein
VIPTQENLSWMQLSSWLKRTFHSGPHSPSHYQSVKSFHGGKTQYDVDDLRSGLRASSQWLRESGMPPQKILRYSEAPRHGEFCRAAS